jgi:hypothetical protein
MTFRNTSGQFFARINDASNDTATPGTAVGCWHVQRRASNDKRYFLNGAQIFQNARASTAGTNATFATGGSNHEICMLLLGASASGNELALYNILKNFLTALTGSTDFGGASANIFEGDVFETQLAPVGGDVTYSLLAGNDSALFSIANNVLTLPAQTFASPTDADANNVYVANLRATRASTGTHIDSTFSVTVKQEVVSSASKFILPAAAGTGDGSSFANAGSLASLDSFIAAVGPGGTINIGSQGGTYTAGVSISHGGSKNHPVLIRGVDASLNPSNPVFDRARTAFVQPPDPETTTNVASWTGGDLFTLQPGANNLTFKNMAPQNCGSFITVAGSIHGITLDTIVGFNFNRFFEMGNSLCVGNVTFQDVTVTGYGKQCIRYRGTSHDWTLDNVQLDSARQDGADFAVGVQMSEYALNVDVTNSSFKNAQDTEAATSFWNGDGFSSEVTCSGTFNFTNCTFSGNTDAGIDIKAAAGSVVNLVACTSQNNKNNFKFWGNSGVTASATFTLDGCTSNNPNRRGGVGAGNHIDGANGANIIVKGASTFFDDNGQGGAIYVMENHAGSYHVASDTIETSGKPRTSFFAGTTIDNVIP